MTENATKTTRLRSPNYPSISLTEAIARAKAIYEKEDKHPADGDTLAKAIGYKGMNGAADTTLSALKKYGLLESVGSRQYKLSDAAIDILIYERGNPDRVKAIRDAAFQPPLFAEFHQEFGAKPPSETNLRARLIKRDYNPRVVDVIIRAYRETLELVDLETRGYTSGEAASSSGPPESFMTRPIDSFFGSLQSPAVAPQHITVQAPSVPFSAPLPPPQVSQEEGVTVVNFILSFPRKVRAELRITGDVTRQDIARLKRKIADMEGDFADEEGVPLTNQPRPGMWKSKESDIPVFVTGSLGAGPDGREYVSIRDYPTGIPRDEIEILDDQD